MGTQVIVPYRDEDEKRHLKLMGDLGQVVAMVRAFVSSKVLVADHCRNGIYGTRAR